MEWNHIRAKKKFNRKTHKKVNFAILV